MKNLPKSYISQLTESWKKTTIFVLILSSIIGCNSKDDSPTRPPYESTTVFDLLPIAVGNHWCIEGSLDGVLKGYETREITKDTVVFGRQGFEVIVTWDNLDPEWSAEHTRFYSLGDSNIFWTRDIEDRWFEFSEFKNFPVASIGDTIHVEEFIDADYSLKRVYTVYDKNASKTVKAGTFENCYVIRYDVTFRHAGELDRHEVYIDYYAPGVGFIWEKDSCYFSNGESEIWICELLSYHVTP
ncbi:MAG: hypothetical protein HQ568_09555 [Calditrichaeota bacterium]|nr:hypothetical protein [Calditrichota bacterium]